MKSRQRKTFRSRNDQPTSPTSPHPYNPQEPSRPKRQAALQSPSPHNSNNPQLQQLLKENSQLRRQIVQLKVHQFYHFDDMKLKELIVEVEQLRKEVNNLKQTVLELQMEKDFLTRTNAHLKHELQKQMTKDRSSLESSKRQYFKPQETTRITDTSRNTQDEISHLSHHASNLHFLQNATLDQVLRDNRPPNDYDLQLNPKIQKKPQTKQQIKQSRKNLIDKVLSPRGRREGSSGQNRTNEYLLYRRRDKQLLTKGQ